MTKCTTKLIVCVQGTNGLLFRVVMLHPFGKKICEKIIHMQSVLLLCQFVEEIPQKERKSRGKSKVSQMTQEEQVRVRDL